MPGAPMPVMKFFVITLTFMSLVVACIRYMETIYQGYPGVEGLKVVPVLLFANIFLGIIHINLSIWYKLRRKNFRRCQYITPLQYWCAAPTPHKPPVHSLLQLYGLCMATFYLLAA